MSVFLCALANVQAWDAVRALELSEVYCSGGNLPAPQNFDLISLTHKHTQPPHVPLDQQNKLFILSAPSPCPSWGLAED